MPTFQLRVSDDFAARFDALAAPDGGRSRVLRQLVEGYLSEGGEAQFVEGLAWESRGRGERVTIRLRAEELARLEELSRAAGFRRASWLTALVRSRLLGRPALNPHDAEAYRLAVRELNRIGVNLNQIARAMNTAVLAGTVLGAELASVEAARKEIRAIADDLRAALRGNRDYWRGK